LLSNCRPQGKGGCCKPETPKPVVAAVAKCMKPPGTCGGKGSTKSLLKQAAESQVVGSLIPRGYGFVTMTAVGSVILVTWKAMKVCLTCAACFPQFVGLLFSGQLIS